MHSYNSKQTKEKYNDHKCESEFLEYLAVTFNILVVDDSFPMRKVIKKTSRHPALPRPILTKHLTVLKP